MPESCKDRCTSAHEYLFHLTKSPRYFYDAEAIKEPATCFGRQHSTGIQPPKVRALQANGHHGAGGDLSINYERQRRNKRSVWSFATAPFPEAHFATFPPALVEPCILAGTSARGVCPSCAAPWERIVAKGESHYAKLGKTGREDFGRGDSQPGNAGQTRRPSGGVPSLVPANCETIGWRPTCKCGPNCADPIPATVLDPFLGAGTTALVAARLGREWVGIELSPTYADIAAPPPRHRPATRKSRLTRCPNCTTSLRGSSPTRPAP
jgi:hypothetical protein